MHYNTLFQDKNFLERGTVPLQTPPHFAVSIQLLNRNVLDIHCKHTASQLHVAPHFALSLSFMRPVFTTELCRKLTVKIYRTPQSKILATPMFLHILRLT